MSARILELLNYTVFANGRIVDTLRPLNEKIFKTGVKSSFPSIEKTLLHMWDAEVIWLHRLEGESLRRWPSEGYSGTKDNLLDGFLESSKNVLAFVESKAPAFMTTSISFTNMKGEPCEDVVEDVLFHVVNHGSYHRGQVITMLNELGISPLPSTDLIYYLRAERKRAATSNIR